MSVKPISYRLPSSVKESFKAGGVAVWYLSRRNLTGVASDHYKKLRDAAIRYGVTRLIAPSSLATINLNQVTDQQIEKCVKSRLIFPGRVLDLRKLRSGVFKSLLTKFLFPYYLTKITIVDGLKAAGLAGSQESQINIAEYRNSTGEKIVAIVDYPEGVPKAKVRSVPWIIVPPAFGKRKETYFLLALYLKKNGFGVLRFDDSCGLGESDGEIKDLTPSKQTQNIIAAIDFVEKSFGARTIGLAPFSLSARPAIKAAAIDGRIKFMLPIVGSPNIQSLLDRVYGEDLIADYAAGKRKGFLNLLGFFMDSDNFLGDAHEKGFADLATTREDMKRVGIPIVWFCGTEDPWVDPAEVSEIIEINPENAVRDLVVFQGLTHRFREAEKAHEVFAHAVKVLCRLSGNREMEGRDVKVPSSSEVMERAIRERQRIRTVISKEEEIRRWTHYLEGFDILMETDDYIGYLDDLAEQLDFKPGEKILDAGCGNGNFIEFFLAKVINEVVEGKRKEENTGEIIGIDIVNEALTKAQKKASEVKKKLRTLPSVGFRNLDIEGRGLPFLDGHFDKVVASLLLSYLHNPRSVIAELCRVTKPGGTVILTSLKPDEDISQIYDRFQKKLKIKYPEEEQKGLQDRGRALLNEAIGWIEVKEEEGQFKYFSASELEEMLRQNGIFDIKVTKSFGDQAIIVSGRKPG